MSWVQTFLDLLMQPEIDGLAITEAMDLKAQHIPKFLYRYRSVGKFSFGELEHDTVWLNPANNFNDPFDSSFSVSHQRLFTEITRRDFDKMIEDAKLRDTLTQEELDEIRHSDRPMDALARKLLPTDPEIPAENHERVYAAVVAMIEKLAREPISAISDAIRSKMLLSCFTTNHQSVVMWSHYAVSHKGVCIEYPIGSLAADDVRRRMLYPVTYAAKMFDATPYFLGTVSNSQTKNPFVGMLAALFKSPEWAYENEWRLIVPLTGGAQNYRMPTPSAVYLGALISDEDRATIEEITKRRGIRTVPMRLAHDEFKIEPLTP